MDTRAILQALKFGEISPEVAEQQIVELVRLGQASCPKPRPSGMLNQEIQSASPLNEVQPTAGDRGTNAPVSEAVVELSEVIPGVVQLKMQDKLNKNTFSVELVTGLIQAFETIQADPRYKVIILTGYDNYFACGGNQEGMAAIHSGKIKLTEVDIYRRPLDCQIPVIAAMQGHGIGGGWCFGMMCDFVVLSRESTYACNHMKYGFTPAEGATLIFPEKLGFNLAQEILFTGKNFRGFELEQKGIPLPVLPRSEVLPYAIRLAKELAEAPRESLILLKNHLNDSIKNRLPGRVEQEWQLQQKTLVNKPEVLEKLQSVFNQSANRELKTPKEAVVINEAEAIEELQSFSGGRSAGTTAKAAAQDGSLSYPELVRLNQSQTGRPVFWFHGEGGGVESYPAIASECERPCYGIQARGRLNDDLPLKGIAAMVEYYVQIIQAVQPEGPYDLGGFSLGGILAYEVARCLQESGKTVKTIVMIDSPDSNGLKKLNFSKRTQILQAVNLTLVNRIRQQPEKLCQKLIHHQELPAEVTDDQLLRHLITIGKTRGLSLTLSESALWQMFQKNLEVQEAFEINQFRFLPLPDPQAVTCYYFRNKSGAFFGEFGPYLTTTGEEHGIDHTDYWQGWQSLIPDFKLMDLEASSHMLLLFEQPAREGLIKLCKQLYSHGETALEKGTAGVTGKRANKRKNKKR